MSCAWSISTPDRYSGVAGDVGDEETGGVRFDHNGPILTYPATERHSIFLGARLPHSTSAWLRLPALGATLVIALAAALSLRGAANPGGTFGTPSPSAAGGVPRVEIASPPTGSSGNVGRSIDVDVRGSDTSPIGVSRLGAVRRRQGRRPGHGRRRRDAAQLCRDPELGSPGTGHFYAFRLLVPARRYGQRAGRSDRHRHRPGHPEPDPDTRTDAHADAFAFRLTDTDGYAQPVPQANADANARADRRPRRGLGRAGRDAAVDSRPARDADRAHPEPGRVPVPYIRVSASLAGSADRGRTGGLGPGKPTTLSLTLTPTKPAGNAAGAGPAAARLCRYQPADQLARLAGHSHRLSRRDSDTRANAYAYPLAAARCARQRTLNARHARAMALKGERLDGRGILAADQAVDATPCRVRKRLPIEERPPQRLLSVRSVRGHCACAAALPPAVVTTFVTIRFCAPRHLDHSGEQHPFLPRPASTAPGGSAGGAIAERRAHRRERWPGRPYRSPDIPRTTPSVSRSSRRLGGFGRRL